MKERNLWSDAKQSEVETAALERIDEAFEKAKNTPLSANSLMDHCFASDTERPGAWNERDRVLYRW